MPRRHGVFLLFHPPMWRTKLGILASVRDKTEKGAMLRMAVAESLLSCVRGIHKAKVQVLLRVAVHWKGISQSFTTRWGCQ